MKFLMKTSKTLAEFLAPRLRTRSKYAFGDDPVLSGPPKTSPTQVTLHSQFPRGPSRFLQVIGLSFGRGSGTWPGMKIIILLASVATAFAQKPEPVFDMSIERL